MLPNKAKQTLAANLRLLSGGTDTQAFRERIAKKTGGGVSARTIGSMMSASTGNPTLANIEAVAAALNVTLSDLFSEGLGRTAGEAEQTQPPRAQPSLDKLQARYAAADPATRTLVDLALADPDQPVPEDLSPSLRAMVNMARAAIRDELNRK